MEEHDWLAAARELTRLAGLPYAYIAMAWPQSRVLNEICCTYLILHLSKRLSDLKAGTDKVVSDFIKVVDHDPVEEGHTSPRILTIKFALQLYIP